MLSADVMPAMRRLAWCGFAAAALAPGAVLAHGADGPATPPAAATPRTPLPAANDDATLALVDGERIGRNGLALLLRYGEMDKRDISAAQLLDEIIEQRLLARHAAQAIPPDALFAEQRVAFPPAVSAEDKLAGLLQAVYRDHIDAALRAEAGVDLEKVLTETPADAPALRRVLGDPRQIRVEYQLAAEQAPAAAALVLARYRLPGGAHGQLTLADIYARQNVQGRINLHQLDTGFLRAQVRARASSLLVTDWAARQAGAAAIAELRRNLLDREYARALAARHGLGADIHDSSPRVDALRQAVTQAEVDTWYAGHREQFRRLQGVRARHIRLADEATAARISRELAADGSNFAALARRDSIAVDAAGGGELGWVLREGEADWFTGLLFAQPAGRNGVPVRVPAPASAAAAWEIVRVDEQRHDYFPRDSETVRYLAAQAIAADKARAEFLALGRRLRAAARITRQDAALPQAAAP